MGRRWATTISLIVVIAVAVPGVLPRDRDSFPLSFYPMYAGDRPATMSFPTAVVRTPSGARERLSIQVIANTDDPLIAAALLRDAIAANDAATLCFEIAGRSGATGTIEVVLERHDLVAFSSGDSEPLQVDVYASCGAPP